MACRSSFATSESRSGIPYHVSLSTPTKLERLRETSPDWSLLLIRTLSHLLQSNASSCGEVKRCVSASVAAEVVPGMVAKKMIKYCNECCELLSWPWQSMVKSTQRKCNNRIECFHLYWTATSCRRPGRERGDAYQRNNVSGWYWIAYWLILNWKPILILVKSDASKLSQIKYSSLSSFLHIL